MPYLIDGHNLIPNIPGMSLASLDDEQGLIELLQGFSRARRQRIEVFFDQAPTGRSGSRQYGLVKAVYVSKRSSADEAIRLRLAQIGREASNWKVVSSDHQVQAEARSSGAGVISSAAFADLLQSTGSPVERNGMGEEPSSAEDVDEWLRLFELRKKKR